jgi:hypothetical protein
MKVAMNLKDVEPSNLNTNQTILTQVSSLKPSSTWKERIDEITSLIAKNSPCTDSLIKICTKKHFNPDLSGKRTIVISDIYSNLPADDFTWKDIVPTKSINLSYPHSLASVFIVNANIKIFEHSSEGISRVLIKAKLNIITRNLELPKKNKRFFGSMLAYLKNLSEVNPQMFGIIPNFDSANEFFSDAAEILPSIRNSAHGLESLVTEFKDYVSHSKQPADLVKEIASTFTSTALESITATAIPIVSVILCGGSLVYAITSDDPNRFAICLATVLLMYAVTPDAFKNVLDGIKAKFMEILGVVPQSGLIESVAGVLSISLLGLFGSNTAIPTHWYPLIANFDRVKASVLSIFNLFLELIRDIIKGSGLISFIPEEWRYSFINNEEVSKFAIKLDDISELIRTKQFHMNHSNFALIKKLILQAREIIQHLPMQTKSGGAGMIMNQCHRQLLDLKKKFLQANFEFDGRRVEPVSIMLQGPPGNGKTEATDHIVAALIKELCSQAEVDSYIECASDYVYTVPAENDFWDGYKSQLVCLFNDFMQVVDNGNPGELTKFMRAKDTTPYILNAAHLEDKGNMIFASPIILLTTNQSQFTHTPSITDVNALYRRVDFCYVAVIKEKYSVPCSSSVWTRKIDKELLPKGKDGVSSLHPSMMEFYPKDLFTGKLEAKISFNELVTIAAERKRLTEKFFAQKTSELIETIRPATHSYVKEKSEDPNYDILMEETDVECQSGFDFSKYRTLENYTKPQKFVNACLFYKTHWTFSDIARDFVAQMDQQDHSSEKHYFFQNYALFRKVHNGFGNDLKFVLDLLSHGGIDLLEQSTKKYFTSSFVRDYVLPTNEPYIYSGPLPTGGFKQFLEERFSCLTNLQRSIYETLKSILPWMISLSAALPLAVMAYKAGSKYFNKEGEMDDVEAQRDYSQVRQKPRVKHNSAEVVRPQMTLIADPNGEALLASILKSNLYSIWYNKTNDSPSVKIGNILAIKGTLVVMPYHFIKHLNVIVTDDVDPTTRLSTVTLKKFNGMYFVNNCFLQIKDLIDNCCYNASMQATDNICVNITNKKFPINKDISHLISTKKDVEKLPRKIPFVLRCTTGGLFSYYSGDAAKHGDLHVVDHTFGDFNIARSFTYSCATTGGDCGAVFTISNPNCQAKIFGMHVAGRQLNGQGFSSIFFKEDFDEVFSNLSLISDVVPQYNGSPDFPLPPSMTFLGVKEKGIYIGSNTSIRRSILYPYIDCHPQYPAVLSREAFNKAIFKYDSIPIDISEDLIDSIMASVFDDLNHASDVPTFKNILSFEDAVFGIQGSNIAPISRHTSPGYPYVLEAKGYPTSKAKWFGVGEDFCITEHGEILKSEILEDINSMSNGIRCEFIFTDNLKDETRPVEKIKSLSTRLFSGVDLKHLILVRIYFGAFLNWLIENKVKNSIGVGVNPYSTDWHHIVINFLRVAPVNTKSFSAGDFSGFDTSGKREVYWAMVKFINEWYADSEENQKIREMLMLELTQSKHIRGKTVYEWQNSLPSGHPLTVYVNSIYNLFALRYCWYRANGNNVSSLGEFMTYVYSIVYGDDNTSAVSEEVQHIFNEEIIQQYMKELDLKYTSDIKGEFETPLRYLKDISFLKRRFTLNSETMLYIAPLSLESVLNSIRWTKKGLLAKDITQSNVDGALRELSLHEEEVFKQHCEYIVRISQEYLDYTPRMTNYRNLRARVAHLDYYL